MVPNHLFQLVAMTAMEPPVSFDAEAIRAKKAEVFRAVHPMTLADAVRGQYDSGTIGDVEVPSLSRKSQMSIHDSNVETFVALRVMIDNWRWAGVPFYLRTGKRLTKRSTEIAIRFKHAPYALFRETPVEELDADWLILQIQPEESISSGSTPSGRDRQWRWKAWRWISVTPTGFTRRPPWDTKR